MKCIICGNELTGKQKKYCNSNCRFKNYNASPKRKEAEKKRGLSRNKYVKKDGDTYNRFGDSNGNWKGGISKNRMIYKKRFAEKNHEKIIVEAKTLRAIKSGKLIRNPCIICGNPKTDAHHIDYSKPLEVIWLCRKHHNLANLKKLDLLQYIK